MRKIILQPETKGIIDQEVDIRAKTLIQDISRKSMHQNPSSSLEIVEKLAVSLYSSQKWSQVDQIKSRQALKISNIG
jgi:hypothetical protein